MLKRQRPPSPVHAAVPIADCSIDMFAERGSKRRRTFPPVLDGSQRGWARHPSHDDQNDSISDDEDDDASICISSISDTSEYKLANTVLRELHTLHQHRLLFSQPSMTASSSPSSSWATQHQCHPTPPKARLMPSPHHLDRQPSIGRTNQERNDEKNAPTPAFEETRVKERYEGANKFLGSLVRSRRRDFDVSTPL